MKQPSTAIKTVALYARVSTKDKGQDTENQLIALREYAGKQGWNVYAEFVDHDSGGNPNRTHFKRMFQEAAMRKFDMVLFWSLDRFSREGVLETLEHLRRLTDAGVNWKSFTEQYLDSVGIFRDAVLSILATIAKQERVRRSERASAAIAKLKRQGRTEHLGRPRVVIDRQKVWDLRKRGMSIREIAADTGYSHGLVQRTVAEATA